jgi:hypothetical protein
MAYTTIDDPSAHFHIQLYTGNNSTTQTITNNANAGDFQADWLWIKNRDDVEQHHVMDSSRGANKFMHPNSDDDERDGSYNGGHNDINAFGSNGFTITSSGSGDELNFGTRTYVAWQWKANGGTRTTNTESGNNPAGGYQANTTAGFSIIDYTGTGSAGTMAHGLGAVPHMIIFKTRATGNFNAYHQAIGAGKYLLLSTDGAQVTASSRFNDTAPTSSVFTVNTAADINGDGTNYIAYAFAPIQGYSKFSSYTGNGSTDGIFVYTGFSPAWVMVKRTDSGNNWHMHDNKRVPFNSNNKTLYANLNNAEATEDFDMLSNGFKLRESGGGYNASGGTYIYMAFAEHPFVSSKGVPVTAR